jgi:putative transcriptional regulator
MASQLAPSFLVAAPSLLDPNFKRSVVLLVDHSPKASIGFVVNRPMNVSMDRMLERIGVSARVQESADGRNRQAIVLLGGPVGPQTGWVLFECDASTPVSDDVVRVSEDVAVTGSRELLETLVARQGERRMLLVLGYAGWGPGQLDAEIVQGAWIPVDFDPRIIFDTPHPERWGTALRSLGIDPARLSVSAPSES